MKYNGFKITLALEVFAVTLILSGMFLGNDLAVFSFSMGMLALGVFLDVQYMRKQYSNRVWEALVDAYHRGNLTEVKRLVKVYNEVKPFFAKEVVYEQLRYV